MDMDKYHLALGRFIVVYADAESHLFITLMKTAGVDLNTAQALFSGTRTDGAIKFIRRIHETRSIEIPARLEDAFKQLNKITTARDHILHHGVRESETGLQSANLLKGMRRERVRLWMCLQNF